MAASGVSDTLQDISLPAGWTFVGLVAGLGLGWILSDSSVIVTILMVAGPAGNLWL